METLNEFKLQVNVYVANVLLGKILDYASS